MTFFAHLRTCAGRGAGRRPQSNNAGTSSAAGRGLLLAAAPGRRYARPPALPVDVPSGGQPNQTSRTFGPAFFLENCSFFFFVSGKRLNSLLSYESPMWFPFVEQRLGSSGLTSSTHFSARRPFAWSSLFHSGSKLSTAQSRRFGQSTTWGPKMWQIPQQNKIQRNAHAHMG